MTTRRSQLQEDTYFRVLRMLQDNPDLTQREIAQQLGVSTSGLNYCLNALIDKGWVKVQNFSQSKNKFGDIYVLTPSGIAQTTRPKATRPQTFGLTENKPTNALGLVAKLPKKAPKQAQNPAAAWRWRSASTNDSKALVLTSCPFPNVNPHAPCPTSGKTDRGEKTAK